MLGSWSTTVKIVEPIFGSENFPLRISVSGPVGAKFLTVGCTYVNGMEGTPPDFILLNLLAYLPLVSCGHWRSSRGEPRSKTVNSSGHCDSVFQAWTVSDWLQYCSDSFTIPRDRRFRRCEISRALYKLCNGIRSILISTASSTGMWDSTLPLRAQVGGHTEPTSTTSSFSVSLSLAHIMKMKPTSLHLNNFQR